MRCENCGFETEHRISFCPNCGSRISMSRSDDSRIFYIEDDPGFASRDSEYMKPIVQPVGTEQNNLNRRGQEYGEGSLQGTGWYEGHNYTSADAQAEPGMQIAQTKPIRALLKPKVLLGLVLLLIVGILGYTFIFKDKPTSVFYELSSHGIQVYSTGNKTLVLDRNGDTVHAFDQLAFAQYCQDRSAAVLYVMEPNDMGKYKFYYVNDKESLKLTDEITAFDMSSDGRYLLYAKSIMNNDFGLYRYDSKTKKEALLIQTKEKRFGLIKASPDGRTITYTLISADYGTTSGNEIETFLLKEGKEPESLGDDLIVIAASNNAEHLYYCDYNNNTVSTLFVRKKDKDKKLMENINTNVIWMNQDYTEVLYSDGKDTYLYDGGNRIIKVAESPAIEIILPYQYQDFNDDMRMFTAHNFASFKNKIIRCSDQTLRFINQYDESEKICRLDPESQIALSSDGNNLLYTTAKGSVKKVSDLTGKCLETTLIRQMDSFITTGNLSQVYYLIGDELFYKEGDNDAVKIVDDAYYLMSNGDYTGAFFQTNRSGGRGVLNYSYKGSKPEELLEGYYVADIMRLTYGCAVQVAVSGGYEYYYSPTGRNMWRFEDEIR